MQILQSLILLILSYAVILIIYQFICFLFKGIIGKKEIKGGDLDSAQICQVMARKERGDKNEESL